MHDDEDSQQAPGEHREHPRCGKEHVPRSILLRRRDCTAKSETVVEVDERCAHGHVAQGAFIVTRVLGGLCDACEHNGPREQERRYESQGKKRCMCVGQHVERKEDAEAEEEKYIRKLVAFALHQLTEDDRPEGVAQEHRENCRGHPYIGRDIQMEVCGVSSSLVEGG